MPSEQINDYYDVTAESEVRATLKDAVSHVKDKFGSATPRAIDCGCGAGRDMAYLRSQGFEVYGFDLKAESVRRCRERFVGDDKVQVHQATFRSFDYPTAELVVANASLFFCPESEFPGVWHKIQDALVTGGIFAGAFLGGRDTMASDEYEPDVYWPDVMTVTEDSLKSHINNFEVLHWREHELDGQTAQGQDHHWHIFELTLQKS